MSTKELTIKLDGLDLSDKEIAELDSKVQLTVLSYLSSTKHATSVGYATGKEAITLGRFNPQWLGIWLKKFATAGEIKQGNFKELGSIRNAVK